VSAIAGLLLAAGAGRRMGLPKGLVRDADGTAWVTRSAQVLLDGGCAPVLVVVGASAAAVGALVPPGCRVVEAADWAEGMGASLRAGLTALAEDVEPGSGLGVGPDVVAVVVGLVDTPGVTPDVVRLVAAQALAAGPEGLARAAYDGVPGHPVALGRTHWSGVAATSRGDAGARTYLRDRSVTEVDCTGAGDGRDMDTPPDLDAPPDLGAPPE
jgi:nicotine blue oxidoreductase